MPRTVNLEVWDQFCEADEKLFEEVLELLKRTRSSDCLGLAYSIFRSYREHKMKIWIRKKQDSCGLCDEFNTTEDTNEANARFDSYGYLITTKKVKKGEKFFVLQTKEFLLRHFIEIEKRFKKAFEDDDDDDAFKEMGKKRAEVVWELEQLTNMELHGKLLNDSSEEYKFETDQFVGSFIHSLPVKLEFNRLSNNLLYDTCKIVDHNPNRIELLYFVDRYNWLVNFEILKNKSQCTIKFKVPSKIFVKRDVRTKSIWYELSKKNQKTEWTAVVKEDNDSFKLIAKKNFREGDLIGYFEGERKEGSGGIKELAKSVVPNILKNQNMMDLRKRIPPQTKIFESGKTPAQHEYHKKNLYEIPIDDLYQRTMGTGSKKVRERLSVILNKYWIKYHINKTDGMIRFPVRVDGSGGKQGGVQFCRDLDYDPITKTYNKTLNNAELLRDGFVVATRAIQAGEEIGYRFGQEHYESKNVTKGNSKKTSAGFCNLDKKETKILNILKHLEEIEKYDAENKTDVDQVEVPEDDDIFSILNLTPT